jgi:hypothetical protein
MLSGGQASKCNDGRSTPAWARVRERLSRMRHAGWGQLWFAAAQNNPVWLDSHDATWHPPAASPLQQGEHGPDPGERLVKVANVSRRRLHDATMKLPNLHS